MILSPRIRIVAGLVGLLSSLLVMALILKLLPDPRETEREWRGRLCESIALSSSVEINRSDLQKAQATLRVLAEMHDDILSAALRQADGEIVAEVGNHQTNWQPLEGDLSTDAQISVPIGNSSGKWGKLEVCFPPLKGGFLFELRHSPMLRLLTFLTVGGFISFYYYLGKVLEQLNPSKAVPGRVRSALDTLAEGLLVLDRKGRIVLCNSALATTLGQDAEKLATKAAAKLPWVRDPNNPNAEFPWKRVLAGEPITTQSSLRLIDPNGDLRIFVVNCSPVLTPENEVRGAVCSFEDITVLESQKVELAQSKAEAEAANEAKSQFLANMSHEIRTPMNAILGFTEILRRGMYDSDEQRTEYLHTIHSSGQHLLRLINDILDLSKVEAGKLEVERLDCSPHEILHDVVTILRVKANEKSLSLTCSTPDALPERIVTDSGRLRQILTNLIGNAIKFTEHGGVSLTARLSPDRSQLIVDVTDTGVGISAEAQRKIFDPFTQADGSITRRFGGTGLGLTISKKFAESLGGDVTVRSTPGQGSTFTVTVAIGSLSPETRYLTIEDYAAHAKRTPAEGAKKHYVFPPARILLADDGEANRQLIELVLRRNGLNVTSVENGKQALDRCTCEKFDVVFMDMQMPVMDGYEATRRLRTGGITQPIIALTANAMHGDEDKCRSAGCSGFLPKPVDLDKLVELLAGILSATPTQAPVAEPTPKKLASSTSSSSVAPQAQPATPGVDSLAESMPVPQHPAIRVSGTSPHLPGTSSPSPRTPVVTNQSLTRSAAALKGRTESRGSTFRRGPVVSSLPLDDPEFREIVFGFAAKLRSEVAKLREAWDHRDLETVGSLAHWLKGAAGTLGFREFTTPGEQLMLMAREKNLDAIEPLILEVEELTEAMSVPGVSNDAQQLAGAAN